MRSENAKYMKAYKHVKSKDGSVYRLAEDMSANLVTVAAVAQNDIGRCDLLTAWIQNWEHMDGFRKRAQESPDFISVDEWKRERESYEVQLVIAELQPADTVRFITSCYDELFRVPDLGFVRVNGEKRKVRYCDDYHFGFVEPDRGTYHICEFAELCERNGHIVEKIEVQDEA